jgi:hypothetical protein
LTRQAACFCSPSNCSRASSQVCFTSFGVRYSMPKWGRSWVVVDVGADRGARLVDRLEPLRQITRSFR